MNTKVIDVISTKLQKRLDQSTEPGKLIPHEDFRAHLKKAALEKKRRYNSWLGWFWKSTDWCWYTFWAVAGYQPFKEMQWFWQRGRRGWSDRDAWSATNHISRIISEMADDLRTHCHGHPAECRDIKEWKEILKSISVAFDLLDRKDMYSAEIWKKDPKLARACDIMTEEENVKVVRGWYHFKKYYKALWD